MYTPTTLILLLKRNMHNLKVKPQPNSGNIANSFFKLLLDSQNTVQICVGCQYNLEGQKTFKKHWTLITFQLKNCIYWLTLLKPFEHLIKYKHQFFYNKRSRKGQRFFLLPTND